MSTEKHPILHLVGDEGDLVDVTNIREFLQKQVKKTSTKGKKLDDVGFKYRVIGVFGGQSSGKSTLLNHIFGTKFETMDENRGRQQTTKGAFMSQSTNGDNVFVIDFEGTDGMERGEDQTFERQLSLFALSIADTLVINMWANEVGRFNAANLSLLRTVFEVNLQLFANIHATPQAQGSGVYDPDFAARDREKPTLLFVLRDHASGSAETMFDSLKKSLTKVWESVTKPPMFAESSLEDLFELRYRAMAHYIYCREKFDEQIQDLQLGFTQPGSEEYLYKTEETFRGVPLEGLPHYLSNCWESIKSSKDLDIPSQRDMLAVVRCNEVSESLREQLHTELNELKHKIKKGERVPQITTLLDDKVESLLAVFHDATKLYTSHIVKKQEKLLLANLKAQTTHLVRYQCCYIVNEELEKVEDKVQQVVDDAIATLSDPEVTKDITKKYPKSPQEANNARVDHFWITVRNSVDSTVAGLEKVLTAETKEKKGSGEEADGKEGESGNNKNKQSNASFLQSDPPSFSMVLEMLRLGVNRKVQARMESMAADPVTAMNKVFEHAINHDPATKMQRTFRSKTVLEKAFVPASHAGVLLLGSMFALRLEKPTELDQELHLIIEGGTQPGEPHKIKFPKEAAEALLTAQRLDEDDEEGEADPANTSLPGSKVRRLGDHRAAEADELLKHATQHREGKKAEEGGEQRPIIQLVMHEHAIERAFELFQHQCQYFFKLQVVQIEAARGANLPAWVWLLFVALGWNEAWFVLTSPVLLLIIVFFAFLFCREWIKVQWQQFEETGPPQVVLPIRMVLNRITQHLPKHGTDPNEPTSSAPKSASAKKND